MAKLNMVRRVIIVAAKTNQHVHYLQHEDAFIYLWGYNIMIMIESSESLNRDVFLCFSGTLNFFSNFLNLWMGDNVLHNLGTLGLLFLVLFPIRQQFSSRDS